MNSATGVSKWKYVPPSPPINYSYSSFLGYDERLLLPGIYPVGSSSLGPVPAP